ncbi:cytochrome P450 6a8-like [Wyeomyia smithii]|uniref:cytochrome P450 6a8-like n=1 Tax=Wyeomyia smithii TaxID=174621 RepID=UPI00246812CB|nr:cytochrome P450 6a8-like [Wyeomyia smithii]
MELINLILAAFVSLSLIIFYFLRRLQSQWSRLGIPAANRPHLLFGNVKGLGQTEHSYSILQRLYWEFKQQKLKVGGFMNFFQPAILVIDPDIAKSVLVRDFNVFHDRGIFVDTVGDPLSGGLFSLEGTQWRAMRQKLTPTFTSGRMRYMYGTVMEVAQEMKKFLAENCHREDLVMKDVLQRFTMDVIGNVAFGIQCNAMNIPDSDFARMGRKAFEVDAIRFIKFFVGGQYKTFSKMIGLKVVPPDVASFFMKIAENTVLLRESENVKRNDFMSLLLEIKNKGKLSTEPNSGGEGITVAEMAAQCFIFFTAGFETSSTTMNFCLYELAMNPELQERLRGEIREAIAKDDGALTYETLLEMDFLDRVVSETLRKYPPVDNVFRMTDRQYTIPDTQYTIPANTFVQIPVYSMHHDAEYFPDPDRFDPDRFLPAAIRERPPFTYLPFGEGPRICIGLRFGQMLAKIGLVTLLNNFRFRPTPQTPKKLVFHPKLFTLSPKSAVYHKIEPLQG